MEAELEMAHNLLHATHHPHAFVLSFLLSPLFLLPHPSQTIQTHI